MGQTTRSGLILYCEMNSSPMYKGYKEIYMLLGCGSSGITTIGGRSTTESDIDRLVREANEETRGILNYLICSEIFIECTMAGINGPNKGINFDGCFYYMIKTDMKILKQLCDEFPTTSSNRTVCNELSSLKIISTNDVIRYMVSLIPTTCSLYSATFQKMFMTVGFDILHNNRHNKKAETININAEIYVPIKDIPTFISIRPFPTLLPTVYGIIQKDGFNLYIGEQFYYETESDIVYRSGVYDKATLLSIDVHASSPSLNKM